MERERTQRDRDGVIDPTENVMALVAAAVKRLDDLHAANMRRVEQSLDTHTTYAKQLAEAEAKRIDAIRAVDVGAVAVASERAAAQAAVLAQQVVTSAETLRALVASTATTVAAQLQQMSSQLTDRLALLEKSQYENKGKSGITAPLLMVMAALAGGIIVFIVELVIKGGKL